MANKLKLFVWTGFCHDYTDGLAFAIAHDETEARKLVKEAYGWEIYHWGTLTIHPINEPIAYCVAGGG